MTERVLDLHRNRRRLLLSGASLAAAGSALYGASTIAAHLAGDSEDVVVQANETAKLAVLSTILGGAYLYDKISDGGNIPLKELFRKKNITSSVEPEKLDYEIWNEPYNEPHQVHELYPGYETYLGDYKLNQLG